MASWIRIEWTAEQERAWQEWSDRQAAYYATLIPLLTIDRAQDTRELAELTVAFEDCTAAINAHNQARRVASEMCS